MRIERVIVVIVLLLPVLSVIAGSDEVLLSESAVTSGSVEGEQARAFIIGYLKTDIEQGLGADWYEEVRMELLRSRGVMEQLRAEGFVDITVIPAEGFKDMVQRMTHDEFDLAFCTSYVYVEQRGDYRVMLQLRRERDSFGRGGATKRGVIIVNAKSIFYNNREEATLKRLLPEYLSKQRMAFISIYSAAGYVYPRLKLYNDYGIRNLRSPVFCDSSEEVVKYVINGLVEIGACESGTVAEVIKSAGIDVEEDKLVRKILETEPLPTDPIVIQREYHPQDSELGREIYGALKGIYARTERAGVPRLEDSRDEYYKNLKEAIRDFNAIGGSQAR
jgi:ABC-type phosphate/phosphonate transport system substrate-binding protein